MKNPEICTKLEHALSEFFFRENRVNYIPENTNQNEKLRNCKTFYKFIFCY